MISRLVKNIGSYSITRDERGVYSLLNENAKEVSCGPNLEAMEMAASIHSIPVVARICSWCNLYLGVAEGDFGGKRTTHGICPDCAGKLEAS